MVLLVQIGYNRMRESVYMNDIEATINKATTDTFVKDVRNIILAARDSVIRSVDTERVKMYW